MKKSKSYIIVRIIIILLALLLVTGIANIILFFRSDMTKYLELVGKKLNAESFSYMSDLSSKVFSDVIDSEPSTSYVFLFYSIDSVRVSLYDDNRSLLDQFELQIEYDYEKYKDICRYFGKYASPEGVSIRVDRHQVSFPCSDYAIVHVLGIGIPQSIQSGIDSVYFMPKGRFGWFQCSPWKGSVKK